MVSVEDTYGWTMNTSVVEFTIQKKHSEVNITDPINDRVFEVYDPITIHISNNTEVSVTINGNPVNIGVDGNVIDDDVPKDAGKYVVMVSVVDTYGWTMNTSSVEFTIVKYNATVEINGVDNATYFAGSIFHINATTNSVGMINIAVNGKSFVVGNDTNIDSTLFEAGHYIVTATVYENDKYTMATQTIEFTLKKHTSEINIIFPSNGTRLYVGDLYDIIIENNTAVNVFINGVPAFIEEGKVINVPTEAGHYSVYVFASETEAFVGKYVGFEYDIFKYDTTISVDAKDITFGDIANINIIFPDNITSNLTIILNEDIIVNTTIENGKAQVHISDLPAGNYNGQVIFYGNSFYPPIHESFTFKVNKLNSTFDVNLVPDEGIIELFFNNLTGYISVNIGGEVYHIDVDSKTNASVDLKELSPNIYNYDITYHGSAIYNTFSRQGSITLSKSLPKVINNIKNIEFNQTQTIGVSVPVDMVGNITFILSNSTDVIGNYSSPIVNGVASFNSPNLNIGTYGVSAQFNDPKYYKTQHDMKFSVMPKIRIPPIVTITEVGIITVELSNASGRVKLIIDKWEYLIQPIEENKVVFIVKTGDFTYGNHTVTFQYTGGGNFDEDVFSYWDEQTKQMRPLEYNMEILRIESKTDTQSDEQRQYYEVHVEDDAEGTIEFFINGVRVAVVDVVDGVAKLDISQYKNGKYIISWIYSGDKKYNPTSGETVLNINRKIIAKDLTIIYSSNNPYSVTIHGINGKTINGVKVTFSLNNKKYGSKITNPNGVASIIISQAPGTYKLTITVLGTSITKKLTILHVLSLQTVKVKRSAKKLVIKATLKKVNGKYLKNKKITFKFNGKKYIGKTNKKGIAKITIKAKVLKKLKPGKKVKYEATYLKDTIKKTVKINK